jgi:hypothetical protein
MENEWSYIASKHDSDSTAKGSWLTRIRAKVRTHGWLALVIAAVTTFGTLSAAAGNAGELVGSLHDGCRFVRICSPEPPPRLIGSLSELRIGPPGVTMQEAYLQRGGDAAELLVDGDWPGQLVTYRLEYQGSYQATCTIAWTLYDAHTGERLPEFISGWDTRHVPAFPDRRWTKEAGDTDVNVGVIWVPYVQPGTFVLEIALLNPAEVLLDLERTEPFEVAAQDVPK